MGVEDSKGILDESLLLSSPGLILDRYQLWAGMKVLVSNKNGFLTDEFGKVLEFDVTNGGDPISLGLYLGDENIPFDEQNDFVTLNTYQINNIPPGEKYAVFRNGKGVRYKGEFGEFVYVSVDKEGSISYGNYPNNFSNESSFNLDGCEFVNIDLKKIWRPETGMNIK